MSLQEFDMLIDRMQLEFEYAENLGQYVDASRILFQMNEQFPDDLQLFLEELDNPESAKPFILKYSTQIKSIIVTYRERLMNF